MHTDCVGCLAKWNDSTCWKKLHTDLIKVYLYDTDKGQQLVSLDSDWWTFPVAKLCSVKSPKSVYYNMFNNFYFGILNVYANAGYL